MPDLKGFKFDRQVFFENFRREFGAIPADKQYVIDGLNRLLTGFETYYGWWDDLRQISNAFAQVGWETAWSYTPVSEGYYLGDPNKPNFFSGNTDYVKRFQRNLRYYPHFGMGDIQLTWLENFTDMDSRVRKYFPERVRDFEQRTGKEFSLIKHPEQALDGWISFCIFTVGMHLGTFREGHNLDRYITPTKCDHFNARSIVNGDKNYVKQGKKIGDHITSVAQRFEKILKTSLVTAAPLAGTTDDEIDLFANSIGPSSTEAESADSQIGLPNEPSFTVGSPEPGAVGSPAATGEGEFSQTVKETVATEDGARSAESTFTSPAGDAPDVAPSRFFSIEDWKPWAIRWASRIWKGVTTITLPAGGGLGFAAIKDPSNWWIYAIVAGVVIVLLLGLGILATLVVAGVWLWQNRGIPAAKQEVMRIAADPNLKNVGITFVKK